MEEGNKDEHILAVHGARGYPDVHGHPHRRCGCDRSPNLGSEMKEIQLTQGQVALVDDADHDWLNKHKWLAHRMRTHRVLYYAMHARARAKGKQTYEYMHRAILGLQSGCKQEVDHRDGNGLNNQQSNLRICTRTQNLQNAHKKRGCTSRYKGVHWHPSDCKWYSNIRVNGKQIHLGSFNSEIDAAHTYDVAALKYFGEFALTNKMLGLVKNDTTRI